MDHKQIFIQMALNAWKMQIKQADHFFDNLSDEDMQKEVAPGRNRVIYLAGHLIAVNDNMIYLMDLGERSYAHLDETFVKNGDRPGADLPDASSIRKDWKASVSQLNRLFDTISTEDWFNKHMAVSSEDFKKEPMRNKLNILLSRTNHLAYHIGQLILAKKTGS